jgi:prepilin peptidase CpaA
MGAEPIPIGRIVFLEAQGITMNSAHIFCLIIASLACVTDLNTRRIPNGLTFGAALLGFVYQFLSGGLDGLGAAALGWFVGAAIFIVPFALGGLGGGDVKLLAALGAWLGPGDAVWLALYTAVAGGAMALVVSSITGYLSTAIQNVYLLLCHWRVAGIETVPSITLEHSKGPKLAYALPILTGMVATIWLR